MVKGDDFIIVVIIEVNMVYYTLVREGEEFVFLNDFLSTTTMRKEILLQLTFEKILSLSNICHIYGIPYHLNYVFVLSKTWIKECPFESNKIILLDNEIYVGKGILF